MVKHGNCTLLLTYSGQEWQFHIATDILWSSMAIAHCYWHLVVKKPIWNCYWHLVVNNANLTLLLTCSVQAWQFHINTDILWSSMAIGHCYWHLVVKNANFTLLLTSSGHKWQIHISTDIAFEISITRSHICQMWYVILLLKHILAGQVSRCSTQLSQIYPPQICQKNWTRWDVRWSTPAKQLVIPPNLSDEVTKIRCEMKYPARLSDIPPSPNIEFSGLAISHCYWHLVVKNDNFTLLRPSSGQEWQFHITTAI